MSAYVIPIASKTPWQSFDVQLDGETFTFEVRWNGRAAMWFLTLSDSDGLIFARRRLAIGVPLFHRYASLRLPKGEAYVIDTTGADEEAGVDDLGDRVKVIYLAAS